MKRPMIYMLISLISGVLIGQYFPNKGGIALFVVVFVLLSIVLSTINKNKMFFIMPIIAIIGVSIIISSNTPKSYEIEKLITTGQEVNIDASVIDVINNSNDSKTIISKIRSISNTQVKDNINVKIYSKSGTYKVGDNISATGSFEPLRTGGNGDFNERQYYKVRFVDYTFKARDKIIYVNSDTNIRYYLDVIRNKVETIIDSAFTPETKGIVKAIITGDSSDIVTDIRQVYSVTGISHILAVSGLHMGLLAGIIMYVLNLFKVNTELRNIITILLLISFSVFTGLRASTIRACIIISIMLLAQVIKRESDTLNSIAFSAFILIMCNPYYLWDMGFQLSYIITCGIVLGFDIISIEKNKFILAIKSSVIAWAVSLPITAFYFYQVPLSGIIANLIVIPLMPFVVGGSLLTIISGIFSYNLSVFFAGNVYVILKVFESICKFFSNIKPLIIETGKISILCVIFIYTLLFLIRYYKNTVKYCFAVISCLILVLTSIIYPRFSGDLDIAMIDVGQGESFIISTSDRKTVLIDGGGNNNKIGSNTGVKKIEPYLKYKGLSDIDMIFITNLNEDHILGIIEILELRNVKTICFNDFVSRDDKYYKQILDVARNNNVDIKYIKAGQIFKLDERTSIECIYPYEGYKKDEDNDTSLVLKLCHGDNSFLFTGDISAKDEMLILKSCIDINCDVLKISNHGSGKSNSFDFINKVNPNIALISYGRNNIYGYPDKSVINMLNKREAEVYSTEEYGTVVLKSNGKIIEVKK